MKPSSKRLELLPEEALYLVERGALHCVKAQGPEVVTSDEEDFLLKPPMSVQQAFSEMIGVEDMTLEKYQVYAYLKRLGYVVTRAKPPTSAYPIPAKSSTMKGGPFLSNPLTLKDFVLSPFRTLQGLWNVFIGTFFSSNVWAHRPIKWWTPLCVPWSANSRNSASLFRSLRDLLVIRGHKTPLRTSPSALGTKPTSPYHVFYNLYKPATPFKKSTPPEPDFQVVVINARTTPMPTIYELSALFGELPEVPPPAPRKRVQPPVSKVVTPKTDADARANPAGPERPQTSPTIPNPSTRPLFHRLTCFLRGGSPEPSKAPRPPPRPNPFPILKQGKKVIVVAVVDSGNVGFFRFGQGAFEDWPMA